MKKITFGQVIMNGKGILSIMFFLLLAFACSDKKFEWEKNKKDCFCGKKFLDTDKTEAIDMTTDIETILNCDGSYSSKENWGTSAKHEEDYKNTVGRTSGSNGEFSGTWAIVNNVSPEDAGKLADPSEVNPPNGETMIKYTSNRGKTRYATISYYENQLFLFLIPFAVDIHDRTYDYKDLQMYPGSCYAQYW